MHKNMMRSIVIQEQVIAIIGAIVIWGLLTISVQQGCCVVTTEYGISSDLVRKSTASLKIKISAA